jgi:hypothetical protein
MQHPTFNIEHRTFPAEAQRRREYFGVRRQTVFRATPLSGNKEKRCRASLSALLVTALQKNFFRIFRGQ